MFATLALGAFERLLNDWIDLDAATRQGFNQLNGKLLRVVIDTPRLSVDILFDQDQIRLSPTPLGMDDQPARSLFEQRPYERKYSVMQADTTLHVPHMVGLASVIGATAGNTGNLPIQGDLAILQQIQWVIAQAEPDISAKLSPWIGDSLAYQLSERLSQGQRAVRQTGQRLLEYTEQQLQQQHGLLASREQAAQFSEGVRDLRNDVERLQARLQQFVSAPVLATIDPQID